MESSNLGTLVYDYKWKLQGPLWLPVLHPHIRVKDFCAAGEIMWRLVLPVFLLLLCIILSFV